MDELQIIEMVDKESQKSISQFEKENGQINKEVAEEYAMLYIIALILGSKFLKRKTYTVSNELANKLVKANPSYGKYIKDNTISIRNNQATKTLKEVLGTDYKGLKFTTNNKLEELKAELKKTKPSLAQLKEFRTARNAEIKDVTENSVRQTTKALLADVNGLDFVLAVTRGDVWVRDEHRSNNGRVWLANTYQPWYDYNCRCFYKFAKKKTDLT